MLVALPVLVALQVLTQAWSGRTLLPIVAVACGAGLLVVVERLSSTLARYADDVTILFGVLGIGLHAVLEGSALTAGASPTFVLAVAFHRIAVGLLIWWLVQPRHGTGAAALGVGVIIAATLAGYVVGGGGGRGGGLPQSRAVSRHSWRALSCMWSSTRDAGITGTEAARQSTPGGAMFPVLPRLCRDCEP